MFSLSKAPMFLQAVSVILPGICGAIGPSADIHIVNKDIQPDGFWRSAVLAGGTAQQPSFPGPLISGVKGDHFRLNVINSLTNDAMAKSTSIHWHGIFLESSSWADGPAFVTQCPITPGHSFMYEFTVPDQAGTFWYHSHLSTQYCDGLRGPFVVYDRSDPHGSLYEIDDESTVITLSDWYHTLAPAAGHIPTSDSTLINGLGRYATGPASPLAIIKVTAGKRYRFRLISMSCDPNYIFSIDRHAMTIIEVDGINTEPLVVDSIQIFSGQRYSFVLEANQTVNNYWIRAQPNFGTITFDGGLNSAILRYRGAAVTDPTTTSDLTNPLLETNLHPLENPGAPGKHEMGGADIAIHLDMTFEYPAYVFRINGVQFVPPTVPVLLQILSGARTQDLLPAGSVYSLPPNKVIEVSIPGLANGAPHPFHLHGHKFDVIKSAGNSVYNYDNPVRRDVVSTGDPTDNVTFRFTTDNAGPWLLHCHIDWHLDMGLALVFAENTDTIATESPPAAWDDLCPIYASDNI